MIIIIKPPALRDYIDNRGDFLIKKRGVPHKKEDPPIKNFST